jgi:two-component system response regulator MprA
MKCALSRILVIDDDSDIREVVGEALRFAGYQVATARDGREGLAACRTFGPSLILLDLMMPNMTGWEFRAAQLRDATLARIPVLVVTALGHDPDIEVSAVLAKPFRLDDLLAQVRRLTGEVVPGAGARR